MKTIGITMGCPAGIGPEIILRYFEQKPAIPCCNVVVLGDLAVLEKCKDELNFKTQLVSWQPTTPLPQAGIPVLQLSALSADDIEWGHPTISTAVAMATYIQKGVEYIQRGWLDAITTCPISKEALNSAGFNFPGHTEMLAHLTGSKNFLMMMAGNKLRITLATIHCPLSDVPAAMSTELILKVIRTTWTALRVDFAINEPRIAVAGLNPHAGENQLFGNEELYAITPAVAMARKEGIDISGPFPADTVFVKAVRGNFDAVVCMYHDQGLIPFKLLHFDDGVNVTLGLPIVRTSVDHGTAYDIAGKGIASEESLTEAVKMAAEICSNRTQYRQLHDEGHA